MLVRVYRNLRRDCYSVVADEGPCKGLVIAYRKRVKLRNVTFKVSEAGRERVIRSGRKNVHAFACGEWMNGWVALPTDGGCHIEYDPYVAPYFRYDGYEVTGCGSLFLHTEGMTGMMLTHGRRYTSAREQEAEDGSRASALG